jgi:hypothetical protein
MNFTNFAEYNICFCERLLLSGKPVIQTLATLKRTATEQRSIGTLATGSWNLFMRIAWQKN